MIKNGFDEYCLQFQQVYNRGLLLLCKIFTDYGHQEEEKTSQSEPNLLTRDKSPNKTTAQSNTSSDSSNSSSSDSTIRNPQSTNTVFLQTLLRETLTQTCVELLLVNNRCPVLNSNTALSGLKAGKTNYSNGMSKKGLTLGTDLQGGKKASKARKFYSDCYKRLLLLLAYFWKSGLDRKRPEIAYRAHLLAEYLQENALPSEWFFFQNLTAYMQKVSHFYRVYKEMEAEFERILEEKYSAEFEAAKYLEFEKAKSYSPKPFKNIASLLKEREALGIPFEEYRGAQKELAPKPDQKYKSLLFKSPSLGKNIEGGFEQDSTFGETMIRHQNGGRTRDGSGKKEYYIAPGARISRIKTASSAHSSKDSKLRGGRTSPIKSIAKSSYLLKTNSKSQKIDTLNTSPLNQPYASTIELRKYFQGFLMKKKSKKEQESKLESKKFFKQNFQSNEGSCSRWALQDQTSELSFQHSMTSDTTLKNESKPKAVRKPMKHLRNDEKALPQKLKDSEKDGFIKSDVYFHMMLDENLSEPNNRLKHSEMSENIIEINKNREEYFTEQKFWRNTLKMKNSYNNTEDIRKKTKDFENMAIKEKLENDLLLKMDKKGVFTRKLSLLSGKKGSRKYKVKDQKGRSVSFDRADSNNLCIDSKLDMSLNEPHLFTNLVKKHKSSLNIKRFFSIKALANKKKSLKNQSLLTKFAYRVSKYERSVSQIPQETLFNDSSQAILLSRQTKKQEVSEAAHRLKEIHRLGGSLEREKEAAENKKERIIVGARCMAHLVDKKNMADTVVPKKRTFQAGNLDDHVQMTAPMLKAFEFTSGLLKNVYKKHDQGI